MTNVIATQDTMFYIVETDKSFASASDDLDAAVKRHGFGVLHVHDLGATLRSKGIDFTPECRVFEVCSPPQAAEVMGNDIRISFEAVYFVRTLGGSCHPRLASGAKMAAYADAGRTLGSIFRANIGSGPSRGCKVG